MKRKIFSPNSILTVIGKDTIINGSLQAAGTLRIDGRIDGDVNVDGDIIIGEASIITASVKGRNIRLAGKIHGNVTAAGKLEILASGKVEGDIAAHTLQVEDGGFLQGMVALQKAQKKTETETNPKK